MTPSPHWLVQPRTIKWLWWIFAVILFLTVFPDFFREPHGHFGIDAGFGFYAWYGFATCALMVVGAKLLGFLLKRPDTYYDD